VDDFMISWREFMLKNVNLPLFLPLKRPEAEWGGKNAAAFSSRGESPRMRAVPGGTGRNSTDISALPEMR